MSHHSRRACRRHVQEAGQRSSVPKGSREEIAQGHPVLASPRSIGTTRAEGIYSQSTTSSSPTSASSTCCPPAGLHLLQVHHQAAHPRARTPGRELYGRKLKRTALDRTLLKKRGAAARAAVAIGAPADVAADVERALATLAVHLSPGPTISVKVAYAGWPAEWIAENVQAAVERVLAGRHPRRLARAQEPAPEGPGASSRRCRCGWLRSCGPPRTTCWTRGREGRGAQRQAS